MEASQDLRATLTDMAKTIAGAVLAYLTFTTVALANYEIPSESMVPHLEVGDRVATSKFAYGYSRHSLPLNLGALVPTSQHRLFERYPERGDVVVFVHPRTGETLIKRAIGLPGDTIEMRDGALWIDGARAQTSDASAILRQPHEGPLQSAERYEETLPAGFAHMAQDLTDAGALDSFGPYLVRDGEVFFMGDNRDNSLDSRWSGMGPVPIENLIGRAEIVYFTRPGCASSACMPRWLRPLHH